MEIAILEQITGLIMQNKYTAATAIIIVFYAISEAAVFMTEKIIVRLTKKTKTDLGDIIIKKLYKPVSTLLISTGAKIAFESLELQGNIAFIVTKIIGSFIAVIIAYIITSTINIIIKKAGGEYAKKTESSLDDHLINFISRANTIIFVIITFLIILKVWGVEIGPLLAGLGIGGIAIAFAMQRSLGNIFGGISLILDKSLNVGDIIALDDGTEGKVLDIGLRSTKIQTLKNEIISVPNGKLEDMKIQNIVKPDPSLVIGIKFSVAYGTDINKARKIAEGALRKVPELKKGSQICIRFAEMGDSSLNFKAFFWINDYNKRFDAEDHANTLVYNALRKNKIEIPFPQMDVRIRK